MANRKKQKQILTLLLGGILLGSAAGCGEPAVSCLAARLAAGNRRGRSRQVMRRRKRRMEDGWTMRNIKTGF